MAEARAHLNLSRLPNLNYIWIGPPTTNHGKWFRGHDIIGPKQMANLTKNPVIFWCLKAYKDHYKQSLTTAKNIQIRSVEEYLGQNFETQSSCDAAKKILQILNALIQKDGNESVRDRVTVKNAFSLILLRNEGGYVLDTNVQPIKKDDLVFPHYDSIHIPGFERKWTDSGKVDFWMMYSPSNHQLTDTIFKEFLMNHDQSQILRREQGADSFRYYQSQGANLARVLRSYAKENQISLWDVKIANESNSYCFIKSLSVQKTYCNTHKYEARARFELFTPTNKQTLFSSTPEGIQAAASGNIIWLSQLIAEGMKIDEQIPWETNNLYEGEYAAFAAMRALEWEAFKMLLHAGANLNLKVMSGDKILSVLDCLKTNKDYKVGLTMYEEYQAEKQMQSLKI